MDTCFHDAQHVVFVLLQDLRGFRRGIFVHPLADQAFGPAHENTRQEPLFDQQLVTQSSVRDFGLHHEVHADAPPVENGGFLCPDPFDWLTVPGGAQTGNGAQLGIVSHAVAADELPTLRPDNSIQRLA